MSYRDELEQAPGVPLGHYAAQGSYFLSLACRDCRRNVHITFAGAVVRFGPAMGVRELARRLRCAGCGHKGMVLRLDVMRAPSYVELDGGDIPLDHWPAHIPSAGQ